MFSQRWLCNGKEVGIGAGKMWSYKAAVPTALASPPSAPLYLPALRCTWPLQGGHLFVSKACLPESPAAQRSLEPSVLHAGPVLVGNCQGPLSPIHENFQNRQLNDQSSYEWSGLI
ncbi:hypothetical protein EVAR_6103_1 [Eumeta japonica]|uniref:Uncharacterized protein n=1 Tax=Eumeta variegata TaxID=151549 RepID=A0A4C1THL6_EUMVA|nr:hypothetical protein EVAR_6103_1 [Eumeta japonica]